MNRGTREPTAAEHLAQSSELLGLPRDARVLIINADCPAASHVMDLLRQHPRIPSGSS